MLKLINLKTCNFVYPLQWIAHADQILSNSHVFPTCIFRVLLCFKLLKFYLKPLDLTVSILKTCQSLLMTSIHVPQVKIQGRMVLRGTKKRQEILFTGKAPFTAPTNPDIRMTLGGKQNPLKSLGRGARVTNFEI